MTRSSKARFRCGERLRDGSVCGEVFTRAGNLQRHLRVQHQAEMAARFRFVYMVPDGNGGLREEQDDSRDDSPAARTAHECVDLAATARDWRAAVDSIARHAESIATYSSNIASVAAMDDNTGGAPKRKRQPPADDEGDGAVPVSRNKAFRFGRARYNSPLPQYLVKRSRASPSQQCAVSWLSSRTKARVDDQVSRLMRSWGVGVEYEASCILVPAKWKKRNPTQVLAQVSFEECAFMESDRLELKADDHQTTFARAVAWFNDWSSPKRGIDLDNFLESGPFQRMVRPSFPTWLFLARLFSGYIADTWARTGAIFVNTPFACESNPVPVFRPRSDATT